MAKEAGWKTMADVAAILYKAGVIPDPSLVSNVVIEIDGHHAAVVTVTTLTRTDSVDKAVREITRKYDLVPREEESTDE